MSLLYRRNHGLQWASYILLVTLKLHTSEFTGPLRELSLPSTRQRQVIKCHVTRQFQLPRARYRLPQKMAGASRRTIALMTKRPFIIFQCPYLQRCAILPSFSHAIVSTIYYCHHDDTVFALGLISLSRRAAIISIYQNEYVSRRAHAALDITACRAAS